MISIEILRDNIEEKNISFMDKSCFAQGLKFKPNNLFSSPQLLLFTCAYLLFNKCLLQIHDFKICIFQNLMFKTTIYPYR